MAYRLYKYENPFVLLQVVLLMGADTGIIIYPLLAQNAFNPNGKQCEISKAKNRHPIRVMNAYVPIRIIDMYGFNVGEFSLYGRDYSAAKYHHDQECRPLRSMFPQPGNGQHKNRRPHDRAK